MKRIGLLAVGAVFCSLLLGCVDSGPTGSQGEPGENGIACWDLDGNGVGDVTSEDKNGDGVVDVADCAGTNGENGTNGKDGVNGVACWDLDGDGTGDVDTEDENGDGVVDVRDCAGSDGLNGANGTNGSNGSNGTNGSDGQACWDLDGDGTGDVDTEDENGDGVVDVGDCAGGDGQPGLGYLALEPAGVVGFVRDTTDAPVIGAKVYLVPAADIPTTALALTDIVAERASTVDEPLEDTIAAHGTTYSQATTDPNGIYRIKTVGAGAYFLVVMPADIDHLPGGSLCRSALNQSELVGQQLDIEVSTTPSSAAEYVGPSVCLTCHGVVHEKQTLHMLGIRKIGQAGPLQNTSRFPEWNQPLTDKFTAAGTTLYFYGYPAISGTIKAWAPSTAYAVGDKVYAGSSAPQSYYQCTAAGTSASAGSGPTGSASDITDGTAHWKNLTADWKVSESNPGSGVSFTATLYSSVGKYYVELTDVKGASGTVTYEAEMSYGGGLYKQRYMANIDGSRYILPIQFNFQGQTDETQPFSRWVWQQYNAQNWYVENAATPASSTLREPAKTKAFDNNCAGCHFSGYSLTGDATTGFRAHAVPDPNGEMDFDGDGMPEALNITCETCHGPGSEHWQWAGGGYAIVSPQLLTPEREVSICAQCHTRALGIGGANTETPMDSSGHTMRAGISRKDFLTNFVSKLDDGLWDASKGDGKHAKKHHQQASDFIKTKKYRNGSELMTCTSCHDPHGNTGLEHQLRDKSDNSSASVGEGLCMGCHTTTLPAGASLAAREQAHYAEKGIANIAMGDIGCVDCHMSKTAKSGAGLKQATIAGVTYYAGDISSHLFDVPLRASIATKAADMMAIPYTDACGVCHTAAP